MTPKIGDVLQVRWRGLGAKGEAGAFGGKVLDLDADAKTARVEVVQTEMGDTVFMRSKFVTGPNGERIEIFTPEPAKVPLIEGFVTVPWDDLA